MLTRHLFNLCENLHPHTRSRSHSQNLTTTSTVSGSLIKLTGAGLSGQAKTSEPSPSCHDMMDLSTTGCQAASQVHLPVGVHQETLAKHPVDLICVFAIAVHVQIWRHVEGTVRLASLAASYLSLTVNMWMDVYLCCSNGWLYTTLYTSTACCQMSESPPTAPICSVVHMGLVFCPLKYYKYA